MTHIRDNIHPEYASHTLRWEKWRLTHVGGDEYIDRYLQRFSNREDDVQFAARKKVSYLPAFSKHSVNDVKNAIFQRTVDVTREGGSDTYQKAIRGQSGGVDLRGSTMNAFMGRQVLPELLVMAKVGVFVDMPVLEGPALIDNVDKRPYIYMYQAEDILNWHAIRQGTSVEFTSLLLRDWQFSIDEETGLSKERVPVFRLIRLTDKGVHITWTRDDKDGTVAKEMLLNIKRIPFILFELNDSLLTDIANYQASMLNLASSDMFYLCNANFPYLTEQFDQRAVSPDLEGTRGIENDGTADFDPETTDRDNFEADEIEKRPGVTREEKVAGSTQGRRYPKGTERPSFIHPSAEPVKASMAKQAAMQDEIRQLLSLSLSNIQPRMASAEAKQMDERGLESGLSAIGLEMENGERQIAEFHDIYDSTGNVATVKYPERYSLQSSPDRREEIKELRSTSKDIPSITGRKAIAKKIVELSVGNRLSNSELDTINTQIDGADFVTGDTDVISVALEGGLGSKDVLARSLGLPGGEDIKIADKEHSERAARVAAAQASISKEPRGVPDLQTDPPEQDKRDKNANVS